MKSPRHHLWLSAPIGLWLLFFLVAPLVIVFITSFRSVGAYGVLTHEFTLINYQTLWEESYFNIIVTSLGFAAGSTLLTLVLGFPVAYCMVASSAWIKTALLGLVTLPFLTNTLVRIYATRSLLSNDGPVNQVLLYFHFIETPLAMTDSLGAVFLGMVINYLPFMVFPIYASLSNFDFTLVEAARDLGASGWQSIYKVVIPAIKSGYYAGISLVFVPTLGEFMIPDLLGGAKVMLLGNLITNQFLKTRNWPLGSALAVLLIVVMVLSFFLLKKRGKAP